MTTIVPTHSSALSTLLGGALDPGALRHLALVTHQHRADLKPQPYPARPTALAMSDDELIDAYRDLEAGDKVGVDKRRQLSYLASWRMAVWTAEAATARSMLQVADSALILEAAEDENALGLWMHLEEVFLVRRAEVPKGLRWHELRDWCLQRAKAYGVLPVHLRIMSRPRGGLPMPLDQSRAAHRAWSEPERDDEQPGLRW